MVGRPIDGLEDELVDPFSLGIVMGELPEGRPVPALIPEPVEGSPMLPDLKTVPPPLLVDPPPDCRIRLLMEFPLPEVVPRTIPDDCLPEVTELRELPKLRSPLLPPDLF